MSESKIKTRQFTGCWTCRYKKKKCDTSNFENKSSCDNCLKNGEICTFHVKLTWTDLNKIVLLKDESISNFEDLVKYNKQLSKQTKINLLSKKKNSATVSDRRFMVYENEHKLLSCKKNEENNYQDIVDKKMNHLLNILEAKLQTSKSSSCSVGPFGVFKCEKQKRKKQRQEFKLGIVKTPKKQFPFSKSQEVRNLFGSKDSIKSTLQDLERERWDSVNTIVGTSDSEKMDLDYEGSLATSDQLLNTFHSSNYITELLTFDSTINDMLLHPEQNNMLFEIEDRDTSSKDFVSDFQLTENFIKSLKMLPVQSKYSLSALAKSHIDSLNCKRNYLEALRLNKLLGWCLVSVDVPIKDHVPLFLHEALENIEFDILNHGEHCTSFDILEVKFINLSLIGLMLREACIEEFCELLLKWFNTLIFLNGKLAIFGSNDKLVQIFSDKTNLQTIFVLIEYFICKVSCGKGLSNINDTNLSVCEKLLEVLLNNHWNLKASCQNNLTSLKNDINKELFSRLSNSTEKFFFTLSNCSSNFEFTTIPKNYSENEFHF